MTIPSYLPSLRATPLLDRFWQDLQLTPGRVDRTLRITLASTLLLVLMLVLQMPFIAYGMYFVFLVAVESPSASFQTGLAMIITSMAAIGVELAVVVLTDNSPVARVLSVSVVTFLAGLIVVGTTKPNLGASWGLLYCVLISFWERHAPETVLLNNSLRLLAAFALSVACTVAVEYLFGTRSPAARLQEQLVIRYQALATMFRVCSEETTRTERHQATSQVSRLAAAGTAGMLDLYNQIVDRNLDTGTLSPDTHLQLVLLARLMDDSAALGFEDDLFSDPGVRQRCAQLARRSRAMITNSGVPLEVGLVRTIGSNTGTSLLSWIESLVDVIAEMPRSVSSRSAQRLVGVPSTNVPLVIPGALRNPQNIAFALKISLCATVCYILYHSVDWPGLSTSVTTVMITGLSTTAAMKQRLAFRIAGALVGGLGLGIGATVFLFPSMDSITSFVILIGVIAFGAAWITGGARFGNIGLQLAFSFYLVALEGFGAPRELAPARDRLAGILLALFLMWIVFDQLWPVRTVTIMRKVLTAALRSAAKIFEFSEDRHPIDQRVREEDTLRRQLGADLAALRAMDEVVEYELGVDRNVHSKTSDLIVQTSLSTAALVWSQVAYLHETSPAKSPDAPALAKLRQTVAANLIGMALAIEQTAKTAPPIPKDMIPFSLPLESVGGEYSRNMLARYEDLRGLVSALIEKALPRYP